MKRSLIVCCVYVAEQLTYCVLCQRAVCCLYAVEQLTVPVTVSACCVLSVCCGTVDCACCRVLCQHAVCCLCAAEHLTVHVSVYCVNMLCAVCILQNS